MGIHEIFDSVMKGERVDLGQFSHRGCFVAGQCGNCDPLCTVYLSGDCPEPGEMLTKLMSDVERKRHQDIYMSAPGR